MVACLIHFGLWLSLVERLVRDEEAVGSNPTSPIKRAGLGRDRNRPHYHCVYRVHGRIFSRRDSDPLVALRGSGSCTTLESFQNTPNYRISQHRHVRTTALLGLILTIFGVALSWRIGTWFPRITGALLIGLGLFYVWRQLSGHAHSHTHLFSKGGHGGNEHEHKHQHELKESLAHFRARIFRAPALRLGRNWQPVCHAYLLTL